MKNASLEVCGIYEKEQLKTVYIAKGGVGITLTAAEWREAQETMRGEKFAIVSEEMSCYTPNLTVVKNREKYD